MLYAQWQIDCLLAPVIPSVVYGSGFALLQGARDPRSFAIGIGMIYGINALQCPMMAIHGRASLWHSLLAGGIVGAVGVHHGILGVPFVSPYTIMRYRLHPVQAGFVVYGLIGGVFGILAGKRL